VVEFGICVPASAPFDAVAFGLNAVDHLCVVPEYPEYDAKVRVQRFARAGGGQAASAAVFLARFGLRVKYVGKVGGDEIGAFSLESIRSEGVDTSDVPSVPGATNQIAMIIVDARNGARTILWHRPKEIATLPDEITPAKVAVGRMLHVDGHDAPAAARAAALARERGIPVVLDAESVKEGTADLVAHTDLLVASSRFPAAFTGIGDREAALRRLLTLGPAFVAMTLGREGALAVTAAGDVLFSRGYAVEVVDTTGAGDVFHGAFVFGLLSGWSVERTLDFSNAAAAMCCTELGARGGARSAGEVLVFMERSGRT
jgi:sugar/nucleoside kinase (ribokinase family)